MSASESPLPTSRILPQAGSRPSVQRSCRLRRSGAPWLRQVMSPGVQLTHGPGLRSLIVPRQHYSADRTDLCVCAQSTALRALLCGLYRNICVCARSTVVFSRRVRPVSFVDDVVLSLTLPYFPGSFLQAAAFLVPWLRQRERARVFVSGCIRA